MAPARIERGLANDIRGNIGGERIDECGAAEERVAGVGIIDDSAADIAAARNRAGTVVDELGGVLD
jgi:hypothetical protein